ncbi:MAG: hypothetical protein NTV30_04435, partial [Chloroflexi bacterium]|nr:hypothetical protein [Chloroflexota bacterium]
TLISQFVTKLGIANSMISKIDNAKVANAKGNANTKTHMIDAFINEVQAQTGKTISPDNANTLITLAKAL